MSVRFPFIGTREYEGNDCCEPFLLLQVQEVLETNALASERHQEAPHQEGHEERVEEGPETGHQEIGQEIGQEAGKQAGKQTGEEDGEESRQQGGDEARQEGSCNTQDSTSRGIHPGGPAAGEGGFSQTSRTSCAEDRRREALSSGEEKDRAGDDRHHLEDVQEDR
ncbi:MAG: hypothetical protein ACE5F1_01060 [Planctomycetota bacterium]